MSENKKREEGLQDYMDLLDVMAKKDAENQVKIPSPSPIKKENNIQEDVIDIENIKDIDVIEIIENEDNIDTIDSIETIESVENIESFSKKEKNIFKRLSNWFNNLPKKKKIIVSIIAILLAFVLTLTASLSIFVAHKFNLLGDNYEGVEYDDTIYDDGEFEDINIDIGSADFKQALKDWATKGNEYKMSSKNVINVLLVGADKGTNSGNTDVMMLVSLNKKTKQLKLVSFFRDSYLYIDSKNGSYCTKLNAAFSMGGPECLIETIENNYKIVIDNYVMVNFESFVEIINAMGGVTVDVQKYEADYNLKKFKVQLPYGEDVTLDGKQALCFCRIRGCDSDGDVSRTRRQRQVIDSIIDRVKNASIGDLNKYIDILLPYVDTGYSKTQIISMGVQALTGKWFNYERTQLQMPDEECRTSGSANAWIWVVDYQLAAHKLQNELYGQSNITLNDGRISIIDVYKGANYSGDYSNNSPINNTPSKNNNDSIDTTTSTTKNTVTTTTKVESVPKTTVKQEIPDTTEKITTEPVTQETFVDTTVEITDPTEITTDAVTEVVTETTPPTTTLPPTPPSTTQEVATPVTEVEMDG